MPKNPYVHALAAGLYIVALVLVMNVVIGLTSEGEDGIFIPMAMLSLFVLSASVMGYLFVYEPFRLFIEGRKEEALSFFGRTVAAFAGVAIVFLVLLVATTR